MKLSLVVILNLLANWASVLFGFMMLRYYEELFLSYRLPISSIWGWALATQWILHSKRLREAVYKPFSGAGGTYALLAALALWWLTSVQYANGATAYFDYLHDRRYFSRVDLDRFEYFLFYMIPSVSVPVLGLFYLVGRLGTPKKPKT